MKTKRKPAKPTVANWLDAKYPFDFAECNNCLTFHLDGRCSTAAHKVLTREIKSLILDRDAPRTTAFLQKHYTTLLALRKKYDRFWPARGR